MGLFDKFKKNTNELLKENVDVNIETPVSSPFDEARLEEGKEEKMVDTVAEAQAPTPEVTKVETSEEVEVLDPGVDLSQVGICKNCGQKIVPGSTVCFLCGKPVK